MGVVLSDQSPSMDGSNDIGFLSVASKLMDGSTDIRLLSVALRSIDERGMLTARTSGLTADARRVTVFDGNTTTP
jgi:hypothetical protein